MSIFWVASYTLGLTWARIYNALDKKYLPVWVDEDGKNTGTRLDRKIDYVVLFPQDKRKNLYQTTLQSFENTVNPFRGDASCGNLIGMGLEVKDQNGSADDAEGQIGIWCTAYFQWLRAKRTTNTFLPPLVACTMVGVTFNFFIAYAIEDPGLQSLQVVCMHFLSAGLEGWMI